NPDSGKTRCVACRCPQTPQLAAEFPRGCVGGSPTFSVFHSSSHFTTHPCRRKGVLLRRLRLTESFFQSYLRHTRGASVHTIRAYRDALKLFYLFLADQKHKPVADLAVVDIQSESVLAFLNHVESKRGNSAVTRNCRLAAVRSFVQHLL